MLVGKVTGRLVSTRKHDKLVGNKFLICELLGAQSSLSSKIIAIDTVGAGMGEHVLIATGSSARLSAYNQDAPVDAAIIGIVDAENDLEILG